MIKKTFPLIFVVYFLFLFIIGLFVKDILIQYPSLFVTANEIVDLSRYGDPGTFAKAALQVAEDGWITNKNQWVFNLWPPGFVFLEALIIKMFSPEVPIILVLQIIISILFSLVFTLFYGFASSYIDKKIAFVLPLLIFVFPVSRAFLLQPLGISFGEGFAIAFYMLFIMISIFSTQRRSLKLSILAGFFLGLSAYFRSNFGAIISFMILFGVILIVGFYLYKLIKKKELFERQVAYQIGTIIFVAFMVSVPWRVYKYKQNGTFKPTMLIYKNLVQPTEKLEKAGARWVVAGKGNMMCLVDKSTCGIKDNNVVLLVKTFLQNPIDWYSIRFEVIGSYWFSNIEGNIVVPNQESSLDTIIYNGTNLIFFLLMIYLIIKMNKNPILIILSWVITSLTITYLAIFTVAHYEVRYFYTPKILILFFFIIVVVLYIKSKQGRIKDSE